ncbi:MAG: L,D-transpeptidase family protein [Anaerolineales bacterium]
MPAKSFSRRDFLKLGGLGLGAVALRPRLARTSPWLWQQEFPQAARLGRVAEEMDKFINMRAAPSSDAAEVGQLAGDTVVEWLREVVGYTPYRNQRWVETPQGYVWAPLLQPVRNLPNTPLDTLPQIGSVPGRWMQVTVPYVEAQLANPPARGFRISFLVENSMPIRFYYGQVLWVDEIRAGEQGAEYHFGELHGSRGDEFWASAEAFKPINAEDVAPISPEVANKQIVINIARQTLSCYEEGREVYFCRVSTGRYGEDTETPVGDYLQVFMKFFSTHMEGGATGAGYDLSGIGWATFIATGGIAIHSTYWHNNFGERTSAGCVNATPDDAKFVYRWTSPEVPYYPGKLDQFAGTGVRVIEA